MKTALLTVVYLGLILVAMESIEIKSSVKMPSYDMFADLQMHHYDSHNHIGGVLGWRGIVLAYFMASEDDVFQSLLEDISECGIDPVAYGRDVGKTTKDLCFYGWIQSVYLRTNGCLSTTCDKNHLLLIQYIVTVAGSVIKEKFNSNGFMNLDVPRQEWSSHTIFPLLQCIVDFSKPRMTGEEVRQLDRMIDSAMSASQQVDFDSSYIAREEFFIPHLMGLLSKSGKPTFPINSDCPAPPFDCKQGRMLTDMWRYALHELILLKIQHVQFSHPHFMIPFENCEKEFQGLPDYGFMVNTCKEFEPLYWLVHTKEIEAVQHITIKYIPMFVSKVFAKSDPNGAYNIVSGQNKSLGEPFVSITDGGVGILGSAVLNHTFHFLDNPHINGVDFASPEYSIYELVDDQGDWSLGGKFLKQVLDMVFQKARQHNKNMFYHIHCGEGFAVFNYHKMGFGRDGWENPCSANELNGTCQWAIGPHFGLNDLSFQKLCRNASLPYSEQTPIAIVKNKENVPLHYKNARDNMMNMLKGISKYRAELQHTGMLEEFDMRVVVVFGHSTHADAEVAKGMVKNKIWADINLSSNLATNSVAELNAALFKKVGVSTPVQFLESLTSTNDEKIPELVRKAFASHGFKTMFNAGVCLTLSTDGSGVEHSYFDQEFKLAEMIIDNATLPISDKIKKNENKMMEFLSGKVKKLNSCI